MSLGTDTAAQLEVRQLSFASPLEVHLIISATLSAALFATPRAFGFVLYAIKRLWGFPLELRIHRVELQGQLLEAEHERDRLARAASSELARARLALEATAGGGADVPETLDELKTLTEVEVLKADLPDEWVMTVGVVSDADEDD